VHITLYAYGHSLTIPAFLPYSYTLNYLYSNPLKSQYQCLYNVLPYVSHPQLPTPILS
jgi:hypothetical protein